MKLMRIAALLLCLASIAAVAVGIFAGRNGVLYPALGLCLFVAGNAFNVLSSRPGKNR